MLVVYPTFHNKLQKKKKKWRVYCVFASTPIFFFTTLTFTFDLRVVGLSQLFSVNYAKLVQDLFQVLQ